MKRMKKNGLCSGFYSGLYSAARTAALVSALMVSGALTAPAALAGAGSTGGGSVVRDERGVLVSADAYFRARNYQLPGTITGPFQWDRFPGLEAEVAALAKFLLQRSDSTGQHLTGDGGAAQAVYENLLSELKSFEIYTASELSGDDELAVVPGVSPQQVAYSYQFQQLVRGEAGRTELKIRRITEIREALFSQLSRREQALILIHEWMHLQHGLGHDLISPVLGNLPTALAVRERQKAAVSELSNDEYRRLAELQDALHSLLLNVIGDREGLPLAFAVNRKGGGVVVSNGGNGSPAQLNVAEDSYVDFDSVVQIQYNDRWMAGGKLTRNTIRNSKILLYSQNPIEDSVMVNSEVEISAENPKNYLDRQCLSATFSKLRIVGSYAVLTSCGMSDTKIEKSRVGLAGNASGSSLVDVQPTVPSRVVGLQLGGSSRISGLRSAGGKLRLAGPASIRQMELGTGLILVQASQIQLEGLKLGNKYEVELRASPAGSLSIHGGSIQFSYDFHTRIELSAGVKNWTGRNFDFSSKKPKLFKKEVTLTDRDFR
jgi:hypothetical protein